MPKRETFRFKNTNASAISASDVIAIEDRDNAEKNDNLPHNQLVMSNQSSTVTIYIYLDGVANHDTPDYILFPSQSITINEEEGVHWSTLFVKNTHASDDVAVNELKYRVSTVKEVEE